MKKSYSIFEHYQRTGQLEFQEIVRRIKNGFTKSIQDQYRDAVQQGLTSKAKALKEQLPAYTPSGNFSGERKKGAQLSYSQEVQVDLDKLSKQGKSVVDVKRSLTTDPYTRSVFTSVGGDGLAASFGVNSSKEDHESAFKQLAFYIERKYGLATDPSCKDITRLRFISYDPDCFYNPSAKIFHIFDPGLYEAILEEVDFTSYIKSFQEGERNSSVYQLAINCSKKGIDPEDLQVFCVQWFAEKDFDSNEIKKTIASGYKKVNESGEAGDVESRRAPSVILQNCNIATSQTTPYLDNAIYQNLPNFFDGYEDLFKDKRQLDMMILSTIVMLSTIFPDVNGVHYLKVVWSNLYLLIYAESGAGKGIVNIIPELMEKLDDYIKNECSSLHKAHRSECATCKSDPLCTDPPNPPKCKEGVFVSANLSSTSLIKTLSKGKVNLLHDSEADVLKLVIAQDWGSQLDPDLRKSYHHETVSVSRVDGDLSVKNPRLGILLTGTPEQARGLTKSIENGLASRLCTYSYQRDIGFKNQFPEESDLITSFIGKSQKEVLEMYLYTKRNPFEFKITEQQKEWHLAQFTEWDKKLDDRSFKSTLYRMGLVAFRIAMVLTAVNRFYQSGKSEVEYCNDIDFNTAISITGTLIDHGKVFHNLLKNTTPDKYQTLLNMLPDNFDRPEFIEVAMEVFNVEDRTAGKKLIFLQMRNLIKKDKHGKYSKV